MRKFVAFTILFSGLSVAPSAAAESGWMKYNKLGKTIKRMEKKGLFPVSVNCRNSPKAKVTPRPQVNVKFGKVSGATDSFVVFHKGANLVYPYNPLAGKKNGWRRVGKKELFALEVPEAFTPVTIGSKRAEYG